MELELYTLIYDQILIFNLISWSYIKNENQDSLSYLVIASWDVSSSWSSNSDITDYYFLSPYPVYKSDCTPWSQGNNLWWMIIKSFHSWGYRGRLSYWCVPNSGQSRGKKYVWAIRSSLMLWTGYCDDLNRDLWVKNANLGKDSRDHLSHEKTHTWSYIHPYTIIWGSKLFFMHMLIWIRNHFPCNRTSPN